MLLKIKDQKIQEVNIRKMCRLPVFTETANIIIPHSNFALLSVLKILAITGSPKVSFLNQAL